MSDYRVQLDVFTGPLDLLLYLIRRDELDVQDIPIARVAEQYLEYVRLLEQIDPNAAGDFLVMATTLVELKSRSLLPLPPLEPLEGEIEDPRSTLVRQLLEYKRFKDAARSLGAAAEERAKRYVRRPADLPRELQGVELEEVQVWDLLGAFAKVMTAIGQGPSRHEVRYDDTPIELHESEIVAVLEQDGPTTFQTLFDGRLDRAALVGRFLALLELIRAHRIRAEQDRNFGVIYLFLLEEVLEPDDAEAAGTWDEEPPQRTMEWTAEAGGVPLPETAQSASTTVETPVAAPGNDASDTAAVASRALDVSPQAPRALPASVLAAEAANGAKPSSDSAPEARLGSEPGPPGVTEDEPSPATFRVSEPTANPEDSDEQAE